MVRQRKRHLQQEMVFRTWGGRRPGAGRKQVKARKSEPHRKREELDDAHPVHVVLRLVRGLGSLRRRDTCQAVRRASFLVLGRPEFRICHISIQSNHIHLLVEAADEKQLARGMQAFQISAARRINRAVTKRSGQRRKGTVFVDRYHTEVIDNPRQARHCLVPAIFLKLVFAACKAKNFARAKIYLSKIPQQKRDQLIQMCTPKTPPPW